MFRQGMAGSVMMWLSLAIPVLLTSLTGCATTCTEIDSHRAAFDRRLREGDGADARLTIPWGVLDSLASRELSRRPPVEVALPLKQLGLTLSLSAIIEGVRLSPAPPGRVGAVVSISLRDGKARLASVELDTTLPLRVANGATETSLKLTLMPRDVGAMRVRSSSESQRAIGDWIRSHLPAAARRFATDAFVQVLADELLGLFAREAWPRIKDDLLGREALFETEIGLQGLQVSSVIPSSRSDALVLAISSGFPDATALPSADDQVGSGRVALRMSGGTVAGLVNQAIRSGLLPGRVSESGEAKADGPWVMRMGWAAGERPMRLHLWRTEGRCERAEIGADLSLALRGNSVAVRVHDGRYEDVDGPAFARLFAWLDNTFGKALSTSLEVDSLLRFDGGHARLLRTHLDKSLLLELELALP